MVKNTFVYVFLRVVLFHKKKNQDNRMIIFREHMRDKNFHFYIYNFYILYHRYIGIYYIQVGH
jgi:hypothetical protein